MKPKFTSIYFRLLICCLLFLATSLSSEAKCPYTIGFTATYVDSGYLFYNSGKISLPVKFDFGDGQTFNGVRPKNGIFHKYTQNGSYTVTMYYDDTIQYCKDTAVQQICFFKLGDSISFLKSNDTLYASAPCYPNAFYRWAYGDNAYGKGCNSWHVYQESGFYGQQLLFVTDTLSGCYYYYDSKFQLMDFTTCGFNANFGYEKSMFSEPLRMKAVVGSYPFLDTKKKQTGRETWYWGDGSFSTKNTIVAEKDTHFYTTHGTYNICHVYEDSTQCKDSSCQLVQVDSCNAIAQFTYTANGRLVTFNYKAAGNFYWYIDGKQISLSNLKYQFPANGTYTVCLKSTGSDNCKVEACSSITVIQCDPISLTNIKWVKQNNDCSTFKFSNTISNYHLFTWDFGDNETSNVKEPTHTYMQDSIYRVKLKVRDSLFNCQDSIEFNLAKYCCDIQDSLKLTKLSANTAKLENYSYIRKPRGPVHRQMWIVEGKVSYDKFPTFTFNSKGVKTITYIAIDTIKNCLDSFFIQFTVDSLDDVPFQVFASNSLGLSNAQFGKNLIIFPNPAKDVLFITGINTAEISNITLYDILGVEISSAWKVEDDRCSLSFPDGVAAGIYFVRIRTDQGDVTVKIFKE